tara:strand:+ start:345 stop:962 length:618 start_codon:yes stop_codon:yes gene_type:complete
MKSYPLHLNPGADLLIALVEIAKKENSSGYVIGVVGNLSRACFQCPKQNSPTVLDGNLEIISLNGTISPTAVHLHLSISDTSCKVMGGHLEPGSIVLKGVDLLIGFINSDLKEDCAVNYTKDFVQSPRLKIYVLHGCPWSKRAIRLLNNCNINYIQKLIESEKDYQELSDQTTISTFPQIFIDEHFIGGYEELSKLYQSGELNNI